MSVNRDALHRRRFSEFLENLKSDRGFSYSKVAENIGISVQGLYKIKRGEINPSKQTIMLLKIKYGLNTNWYETGQGTMEVGEGSGLLERSDEILMELIRMKNHVIEELTHQNESLKKKNAIMQKKIGQKAPVKVNQLNRAKYNEYKQLLQERLTGLAIKKLLTGLSMEQKQLIKGKIVSEENPEKTLSAMISGGTKLVPKKVDERLRQYFLQELEKRIARNRKNS